MSKINNPLDQYVAFLNSRIERYRNKISEYQKEIDRLEKQVEPTPDSNPLPSELEQKIYTEMAVIFSGKGLSDEQHAALMDDRKESVDLIMRTFEKEYQRRIEAAKPGNGHVPDEECCDVCDYEHNLNNYQKERSNGTTTTVTTIPHQLGRSVRTSQYTYGNKLYRRNRFKPI